MAEMVLAGKVPPAVVQSAAAGKLSLPPGEAIEVLLLLMQREDTREAATASFDAVPLATLVAVCADPATPKLVLDHFIGPRNQRPELLGGLIENPSVPEANLVAVADLSERPLITAMLGSKRVRGSGAILTSLYANRALEDSERQMVGAFLKPLGKEPPPIGNTFDHESDVWFLEHAAAIAWEGAKTPELTLDEEELLESQPAPDASAAVSDGATGDATSAASDAASAGAAENAAHPTPEAPAKKLSTLQKLNKMNVAQRIKIGMLGSSEERNILIRDSSRMVYAAVLASPKLSDAEVENFASLKNVQQGVLREIARNRKYMKNYSVVRQLCNNPRCPMDLSLPLLKHLRVPDLKALSMNKNVPETLRKIALKDFKEKSAPPGKKAE